LIVPLLSILDPFTENTPTPALFAALIPDFSTSIVAPLSILASP
jgi:hypothetical protein